MKNLQHFISWNCRTLVYKQTYLWLTHFYQNCLIYHSGNLFSVTEGGLAAGCNADYANAIQHDQDMISTTKTGAVRCCSFDGESCKSKIPDCSTLSFSKAQQKCSEFRMRLCTKEELSNNICCGTGCSFDLELVWYTKGNMFCSSIKI